MNLCGTSGSGVPDTRGGVSVGEGDIEGEMLEFAPEGFRVIGLTLRRERVYPDTRACSYTTPRLQAKHSGGPKFDDM